MDTNLSVAIVSASGTTLVAIAALVINSKRLDDTNYRISELSARMDRLEAKLDRIVEMLGTYAIDVARIKEKLQIP